LYKVNPTLEKSGLRKGEKITIPVAEADVVVTQNTVSQILPKGELAFIKFDNTTISNAAVREVLPNETKYAIAREYGFQWLILMLIR
jgi:hypothetical protein